MRISFPDCPYHCTNGILVNPYKGVSIPCPHCEQKRKEKVTNLQSTVEEKSIYEQLRITQPFTGSDFNMKRLIPDYALKYIEPESVEVVERFLNEMFTMIGIGEYLDYSVMFNMGKKAHVDNLIVPYMLKAYENGIKVAPYLDVLTLCKLRRELETTGTNFSYTDNWGSSFNDYVEADICFVYIDAGVTQNGVDCVKGLMQIRASKGRPTYIVTDYWRRGISDLVSEEDEKCLNLAYLVSVEYKKKDEEVMENNVNLEMKTSRNTSTTLSGMTKEEFNKLTQANRTFL